jgi:GAF domain-containing protein/sugar diacid utilization regulator
MESLRELAFLQRLSLTAAQTLDADALVQLVIDETTGALDVDVCSVYLLESPGNELVLTATNGLAQAGVGHVRLQIGEGITGWAAQDRRPVVVPDVREERRFRWMHGVDQARFVSMCSVPIMSADRLVGVLNVQTDERRVFTHLDVEFLVAIAAQTAGVLERSAMHERLARHLDELSRSEQIHRRFTELSLSGAGLQAICEAIAEQVGTAVALYDENGLFRVASADDVGFPERLVDVAGSDLRVSLHPVQAGPMKLADLVVIHGEERDGVSARAIEHGVTVIALELAREQSGLEVEARLHGDVIEGLLASELPDAEVRRLVDRAMRLGISLRSRAWVVVVRPDGEGAMRAFTDPVLARRVMGGVSLRMRARHDGTIVLERGGALIILIPEPVAVTHVERTTELVLADLARIVTGDTFSAGVSGSSGAPGDLHSRFAQAQTAIEIGGRVAGPGVVSSYRRLGAERILTAAAETSDLEQFVDEWLGPFMRAADRPPANVPPLDAVIEALVECSWSLRATARALDIEPDALSARVQRARAVCGRDLDDPNVRLSIALALRARRMSGPTGPAPADREEPQASAVVGAPNE